MVCREMAAAYLMSANVFFGCILGEAMDLEARDEHEARPLLGSCLA